MFLLSLFTMWMKALFAKAVAVKLCVTAKQVTACLTVTVS